MPRTASTPSVRGGPTKANHAIRLGSVCLGCFFVGGWSGRAAPAASAVEGDVVEHIALVHITHLDLGYTDHPLVARDYHRRSVDI